MLSCNYLTCSVEYYSIAIAGYFDSTLSGTNISVSNVDSTYRRRFVELNRINLHSAFVRAYNAVEVVNLTANTILYIPLGLIENIYRAGVVSHLLSGNFAGIIGSFRISGISDENHLVDIVCCDLRASHVGRSEAYVSS